MIRRTTARRSPRRGLATFLLFVLVFVGLLFGGTTLGTAGGLLAGYNYFASGLPDPHLLDNIQLPQTTYVYDRTGSKLLARFECQNRQEVTFADVPKFVADATVSAEDRTFWTNDGIDYAGVGRAAIANLKAGGVVQGASTITQQVIKYSNSVKVASEAIKPQQSSAPRASGAPQPSQEPNPQADDQVCKPPQADFLNGRSLADKIREAILAREMTAAYAGRAGKQRILATYLNLIFYGNGSYGIKAAAANYFGITDLSKLTLAQSAFLAGIPQLPTAYDPYINNRGPARAITRRNDVLDAMLHERYITKVEHDKAVATTWQQMKPQRVTSVLLEPQFTYRVQSEAEQILARLGVKDPAAAVRTGGYRITTTLDYPLQQVAKARVRQWVEALVDKNVHNSALVAINSATGEIVAYVGSVDYYNRKDPRVQGQFDVAGLGRRQPGSAFKPITYSSAFKARKATVSTMLVDALTDFGGGYLPTNADVKEHGPVLATDALRYSLNIPSVQMQYLVGPETTSRFAESVGVASRNYLMGQDPGLTLTLGSVPVNLTNMTQAYSVFAAQGSLHPATTIREVRDRNGRVIYSLKDNGPQTSQPMKPAEAYLTHWILEGNTDPARNLLWGTRTQLNTVDGQRRPAGFKTGTTNDFRDVSAFGYVPGSLVTGVWMGNNNQEPMSNALGVGLFSADGPLYLWHDFMDQALNKAWDWNGKRAVPQTAFPQPPGITTASVCRFSGMADSGNCGLTQTMPFLDGTVPAVDNVHGKGCFDIVAEVRGATPQRPDKWVTAAQTWVDRLVNGQWGARGSVDDLKTRPDQVRFQIARLYGNSSFGDPVCGQRIFVPGSPKPRASGGPPGPPTSGSPKPTRPPRHAPATSPPGIGGGLLIPLFATPAALGLVPLALRVIRRRRTRA